MRAGSIGIHSAGDDFAARGEYVEIDRPLPHHGMPLLVGLGNPIVCLARENIVRKTLDDYVGGKKSNKKTRRYAGYAML